MTGPFDDYIDMTADSESLQLSDTVIQSLINLSDKLPQEDVLRYQDMLEHKHHYAVIFKPSEQRWSTHIIAPDGKKKRIVRKRAEDLYAYLDAYYAAQEGITLQKVYEEWIAGRIADSPGTARKDVMNWNSLLSSHTIAQTDIRSIDLDILQDYLRETCPPLSHARAVELKTMLNALWDFAYEKSYVDDRVPRRIAKFTQKSYVQPKRKTETAEEVFAPGEIEKLCSVALDYFQDLQNPTYLSIPLAFQTGLRIGEMVALQFGDINSDILQVQRMEQEVSEKVTAEDGKPKIRRNGFRVVDYLKSHKEARPVPITPEAAETLQMLRDFYNSKDVKMSKKTFLFLRDDGGRHTSADAEKCLRRCCKKADIPQRSFHKLRKTYASTLLAYGMPATTVRDLLGHEDAKMTLNVYGKDVLPAAEVQRQIAAILSESRKPADGTQPEKPEK